MNTKISKGLIGITLAFIMVASIFAALSPSSIATRESALDHTIKKVTIDSPGGSEIPFAHYKPGETVYYRYAYTPNSEAVWLLSVDDEYPDGTIVNLFTGNISIAQYDTYTGETQWTIPSDWTASQINNRIYFNITSQNTSLWDVGTASCQNIIEFEPPDIDFNYTATGCLEVEFCAWMITDGILNWTFDFGDGATADGTDDLETPVCFTHTYSTCGSKTVKLSACNEHGCVTVTKTINVACEPVAFADADEPCYDPVNGTDITFCGSATGGTPPYEYDWTFTGGWTGDTDDAKCTTVTGVNENITATVTVTDALGCEDEYSVSVEPCAGCTLRLYGTFCQGAGDDEAIDPYTGLYPENYPYTDPVGPFHPQNPQAPRKDFITFNPAIMDHNWHPPGSDDDYDELIYDPCSITEPETQHPQEKVFKRMWYKKEWFKDHTHDGCFTVIIDKWDVAAGKYKPHHAMCLDDWNAWTQEYKHRMGYAINESNNVERDPSDPLYADIYGPAIIQEFTFMTLDGSTMPILVNAGSSVLIPMASWDQSGNGIDSFDADGDGDRDAVQVHSEFTLGIDVDGDGVLEHMNQNDVELDGDESVVLTLPAMRLTLGGGPIRFFDHEVTLTDIFGAPGNQAVFTIKDLEGGGSTRMSENVVMGINEVRTFYRAKPGGPGEETTFYLKVTGFGGTGDSVIVEVGRMFGQTHANIGANPYWNQKAFIVDGVFYNVVAIKSLEDCFKFISIRQKLPKVPIKLYGKHLTVWGPGMILPELPPFNEPHNVLPDVQDASGLPNQQNIWTIPKSQGDKIPLNESRDPLRIDYVWESVEPRYKGELKEIYNETHMEYTFIEYWNLEWFHTKPWQFTEFRLPKGDTYLVTLSWFAPESEITLWDDAPGPVAEYTGERFKFWYEDCSGPLYIDRCENKTSIRIYGTYGEGAGDNTAIDPVTDLRPENFPYTDPVGPFHPQHWQAPEKDFMTFNPAFMDHNPGDHNPGYPGLDYAFCEGLDVQRPREKVFKRMWYEKEWFKDHTHDGCFTVIVDKWDAAAGMFKPHHVMCLDDWNKLTQRYKFENQLQLNLSNNVERDPSDPLYADIYAPAINQEFTFMTLDGSTMPALVRSGSNVLIPMASEVPGNGIDSFDADGDGEMDTVRVMSEFTLGLDIDGDLVQEHMNQDDIELNGDESVVLVIGSKRLEKGQKIQLFDHIVELSDVFAAPGNQALFNVWCAEGTTPELKASGQNVALNMNQYAYFYRGTTDPSDYKPDEATFYLKVISADASRGIAIVEVGRMFGQTHANIGANPYWNQKAFMVDGVFYNVVAIKTLDDCFKFITFRQKLPKMPIKLWGVHLEVWAPGETLPELPPFNMEHYVLKDIQNTWTTPTCQRDKIGPIVEGAPALNITYCNETHEERFKGQLLEIYNESHEDYNFIEYWNLEWFHTLPWQYTEFIMPPENGAYLMTLAWFAPQAEITFWDDAEGPVAEYKGERVKFWFDPLWGTRDLYVNREAVGVGAPEVPGTLAEYYDSFYFGGGDLQGDMDADEVIKALLDYIAGRGPFAGSAPLFDHADMTAYMMDFLDTLNNAA
ncbi:MAG: PKD domain-containing protein [Candidatus Methanospirareceae archaeon]